MMLVVQNKLGSLKKQELLPTEGEMVKFFHGTVLPNVKEKFSNVLENQIGFDNLQKAWTLN